MELKSGEQGGRNEPPQPAPTALVLPHRSPGREGLHHSSVHASWAGEGVHAAERAIVQDELVRERDQRMQADQEEDHRAAGLVQLGDRPGPANLSSVPSAGRR